MPLNNRREGFALVAAIGAIVVIAALVAGAFYASTQEYRVGRNTITAQRSFVTAEYGLNQVVQGWDKAWNTQPTYTVQTFNYTTKAGDPAVVKLAKTSDLTYVVSATGSSKATNGTDVSRRTTQVIQLGIPSMYIKGAITVAGSIEVQGSALIVGNDATPTGWQNCPPSKTGMAAIVTDNAADVKVQKASSLQSDAVNPILVDAKAGDSKTYTSFGDMSYEEMAASADIVVAGGNIQPTKIIKDGKCYTTDVVTKKAIYTNWGDPYRATPAGPCEAYAPIIHVTGDLHLNSNAYGQGILLVDGSLTVNGNFDFYGIIVAKGKFINNGTADITGAVMAGGVVQNSITGNATVKYSSCAIDQVTKKSATVSLVHERPWAEMF